MNQAYLVTGPESSGTCYLAQLLIDAGCTGRPGGPQPFDGPGYSIVIPEPRPQFVVVQRSLPHGGKWPDLHGNVLDLRRQGYGVTILILSRDQFCHELAQRAAEHSLSKAQHLLNVSAAWREVFSVVLGSAVEFVVVPYSSLGRWEYRHWLATHLALPGRFDAPYTDGDQKYLEA